VLFTGLALGTVYRINLLITKNQWISLVLAASLLIMHGLFVEHKFYAPDQMANFLLVASLYMLCRDRSLLGRDYLLACTLFGLAVAQKIPLAAAGPAFAMAVILSGLQQRRLLWTTRQAAIGVLLMMAVFALANFSIFLSWENFAEYRRWMQRGIESSATGNFGRYAAESMANRIAKWLWLDDDSVSVRFCGVISQLILLICAISAIVLATRRHLREVRNCLLVLGFAFLPMFLANVLLTDRIWYWHLSPVFFLALSGVAGCIATLPPEAMRIRKAWVVATVLVLVIENSQTWWNVQCGRLTEHQTAQFVRQRQEMFAIQKRIVDFVKEAPANLDSADVVLTELAMENPEWYSQHDIRAVRHDACDIVKFLRTDCPSVIVLNLENSHYHRDQESVLAEFNAAVQIPRKSRKTMRWYVYEPMESISGKHMYRRVRIPAALARLLKPPARVPESEPGVIQATFEENVK
jgi:hypothetical protein